MRGTRDDPVSFFVRNGFTEVGSEKDRNPVGLRVGVTSGRDRSSSRLIPGPCSPPLPRLLTRQLLVGPYYVEVRGGTTSGRCSDGFQ